MVNSRLVVVGDGPVAKSLVAGAVEGLTLDWLVYPFGLDSTAEHGIVLNNGPKVVANLPDASFRKRVIPGADLYINPSSSHEGGINVFSAEPGETNPTFEIRDGDTVAIAMKTYGTFGALEQLSSLLEGRRDITILLYQNGFRNETKVEGWLGENGLEGFNVVRAVALGPCTSLPKGGLDNQIFNSLLGHRDIDDPRHVKLSQRVAEMFGYIPVNAVPVNVMREVGGLKASANLFNAAAYLFGCNFEEGIGNVAIRDMFRSSIHESARILREHGIDIGPRKIDRVTSGMFDSLRGHIASMGNEHLGQIRVNGQSPFMLATEVDDLQGDVVAWGKKLDLPTFWNSFAYDLITDSVNTYNLLRLDDGSDKAIEFIARSIARNRHIVGLDPYAVHRNAGHDYLCVSESRIADDFSDVDLACDRFLHTCARYTDANKGLVPLMTASYASLKTEYAGELGLDYKPFNLSQSECSRSCNNLRACYQI